MNIATTLARYPGTKFCARVPFCVDAPIGPGLLPDCEGTAVVVGSADDGWEYASIELRMVKTEGRRSVFADEPLECVAKPDAKPDERAAVNAAWALRASIIAALMAKEADWTNGWAKEISDALAQEERDYGRAA